ncbi:MAG: potassium channel protein, partial [bacterium]|nr:potassium channel protein [bacterium]
MSNLKKILMLFSVLLILVLIDTFGYVILEKASLFDAFYMTIISITTVGYTEVFPISTAGKLFTIWVIISGLSLFFYIAGTIAESAFEGNIRRILGRRKMKILSKLKNHVIIAGYGKMGEVVAKGLINKKVNVLILEKNSKPFSGAEELECNVIQGDATDEGILEKAGVNKAKSFVSLLSSDADNIFTVMAVREFNPDISIISRAMEVVNVKRLYKVGANQVISPYQLSSSRIVNSILKPNVLDFIDVMFHDPEIALSIEELTITEESPFAGKNIMESGMRDKYDIIIIAIKR